MCKATTEVEFQWHSSRMRKLKDKALRSFMTKDPKYWSKAYFSTRSKCDAVDNNFSEAFNSTIVPARFKSIISLFEDVRHYVMNRLVSNKLKCQNWKTELCPKICKKLEGNKTSSAYYHVTWNGADGYEVFCNGDVFIVDIKRKPRRSSQILISKPHNMKYSITRAHSPSVPFKSSPMASRPPTSTSLPLATSSQPPTTVSLPLSTGKFYVLKYNR
ncbi:hypothetical protein V6N13_114539 [Hibiscus sabdariffa]